MTQNEKLKLLQIEINAFYKTYRMLKEDYEQHNKDFQNLDVPNEKLLEYIDIFPSLVVNGCFSAELCLKYIFIDSNIYFYTGEKGHDLFELYNLFFKINCNKLRNHYTKLFALLTAYHNQNELTINKNLQTLSKIYNNYRYMWYYLSTNNGIGLNYGFFTFFVETLFNYVINQI